MYYFNLIPGELFKIIISYFDYDDFIAFSEVFDIDGSNYSLIYYYRFNTNKNINYTEYKKYLGISDIIERLYRDIVDPTQVSQVLEKLSRFKVLNLPNKKLTALPSSKVIQPKDLWS